MTKTKKGIRRQNNGGYTITLRVYSSPSEWKSKNFKTYLNRKTAVDRRRFINRRIALSYFRMLDMPYKTNTEINSILLSLPLKVRIVYFAIKASAKAERLNDRGVYLYHRVSSAEKAGLTMPYFLRYRTILKKAGLLATKKINGDSYCYFPERKQDPITDL